MHACVIVCVIRELLIHFFCMRGPLRGQSIVLVPCPLPRDIHHRGAPTPPLPTLPNAQGKVLMRARSPHPSGPYGDHLQYSTGTGQTTPEPQIHTHTTQNPVRRPNLNLFLPLNTSHLSIDVSRCKNTQKQLNTNYLFPLQQTIKSDSSKNLSMCVCC